MYNKVLKKNPDDYATIKNCVLLARNDKNVKLEKKYLPMLIRVTPDETEKAWGGAGSGGRRPDCKVQATSYSSRWIQGRLKR